MAIKINGITASLKITGGGSSGGTDTSDATATASDILSGKTAYGASGKLTGTIETKASSDLTASGATVTVPAGYYASSASKSVATVTQATPTISVSSSGLITASVAQSAGYVSAGTTSATKQLTTLSAMTYTPSTTDQTIASEQYLSGAQTIKGDSNLIADNIKSGVTIFGITGTYDGSGSSSGGVTGTVDTTLDNNSWATISAVSDAGAGESYWSVGDTKAITINGTVGTLSVNATYYVYIIGFNHNSDLEGTGIQFQGFKTAQTNGVNVCLADSKCNSNVFDGKYFNMNHWNSSSNTNYDTNYGGWSACDMRYDILGSTDKKPSVYGSAKTAGAVGYNASETCATNPVANTLMAALPSDLRAVMKPITKYTDNTGNAVNTAECVTATVDYLPLLAEYEISGARSYANQYEQNYQKQYDYYSAGGSKIKYMHSSLSSATYWWLRSAKSNTPASFCYVEIRGYTSYAYASYACGVAPAFMV